MARIVTMMIIVAGVMLLLGMGGAHTTSNLILQMIGLAEINDPTGFSSSALAIKLGVIFAKAMAVGIIVGYVSRQSTESFILASLAGFLTTILAADIWGIYVYYNETACLMPECKFVSWILLGLLVPLFAGLIISLVQWWRGNDV